MRLTCATWKPVAYKGLGQRTKKKAAVLHTNGFAAPNGSLFTAFTNNALGKNGADKKGVGAHIQVMKSGKVEQYVDTDLSIGHAWDANGWSVGIETEDGGDCESPWPQAQIDGILKVLRELGVPGQKLKESASDGVGWHRQYASWNKSNHSCPCNTRQAQINDVIIPALQGGEEDDVALEGTERDALAALWGAQRRTIGGAKPTSYGPKPDALDNAVGGWDLIDKLDKALSLGLPAVK